MTNARKTWWYAIGQNKFGPCSSSELIQLVEQGKLFPDSLVWKEGMAKWVPASRQGFVAKVARHAPLACCQQPSAKAGTSTGAIWPA